MKDPIQRYLNKRADLKRRPLFSASMDGVDVFAATPMLAVRDSPLKTLESLAKNPAEQLARTLVICAVNNRAPGEVDDATIQNNQDVLAALSSFVRGEKPSEESLPGLSQLRDTGLRLAYVDASSPGCELAAKEGVGVARKIGLDWGVEVLRRAEAEPGVLLCLDADTIVEPNYLAAVREHFVQHDAWAAALAYAHRLEGSEQEQAAIVCYELFLRYHVLGLQFADSPYAFHTIGSTMACTPQAYAAISGMNRREAGEDFHFLQQLAKTGPLAVVDTTTVRPSCRASHRVPFGTGRRVRRYLEGTHDEYVLYHPDSYRILKEWLTAVATHADESPDALLNAADSIAPQLCAFLDQNNFANAWTRLRGNSPDRNAFLQQFHRWFDGFKTLKLMHHLRDNGFPEQDMFEALGTLLDWIGRSAEACTAPDLRNRLDLQQSLLSRLRGLPIVVY